MKINDYDKQAWRQQLALAYVGKQPMVVDELHQLANWVETGAGVFVRSDSTGAVAAARRVRMSLPEGRAGDDREITTKRPYTKRPGVLYGRAAWAANKKKINKAAAKTLAARAMTLPKKKTKTKRKYTKRDKAFWKK